MIEIKYESPTTGLTIRKQGPYSEIEGLVENMKKEIEAHERYFKKD